MSPGFNPSDPIQVAVRISELGQRLEAMQLSQTQAQQNLATVVQSLQLDLHDAVQKWGSFSVLADRQLREQGLLSETQAAVRAIAARVDSSDRRLSRWGGMVLGISLCATTLVGAVTWFGRQYMDNTGFALREVRGKLDTHAADALKRDEESDGRMDRVEIYLAGPKVEPFRR